MMGVAAWPGQKAVQVVQWWRRQLSTSRVVSSLLSSTLLSWSTIWVLVLATTTVLGKTSYTR